MSSSRRRTRSRSRSYTSSSSKLRMDKGASSSQSTNSGRRREIDSMIKRARASPNSNTYWDKKLLEAEAKEPNRWRHSGYKSLYVDGESASRRRSRSRSQSRRRSRTRRQRTPQTTTSRAHSRATSASTCSDDNCSVCSPRHHIRSRSSSPVARTKAANGGGKKNGSGPKARPRPPSPHTSKPSTSTPTDPRRPIPTINNKVKENKQPALLTRIKKERNTAATTTADAANNSSCSDDSDASSSTTTTSPIVQTTRLSLSERFGKIAQWSADRERRDMENMRITKTGGGDLKVMIEGDEEDYHRLYGGSPPRRYSLSPVPVGHYPDTLLSSGQSRLAAWDDVRVRYKYYKDLGYLRDLSLDDYVKWEEWWYKYQDWLTNERQYEHWLNTQQQQHHRTHRRRKRVPITQRLN